jgi:hypothetical protein
MKSRLPQSFVKKCQSVTAKRARTVIDHILKHGFITTEELKEQYGYNHPPRAARDVREQGIPLETYRVVGSDGRRIAAYRFGNPAGARKRLTGRTAFSRRLKVALIKSYGCKCSIYLDQFDEANLQIDHRIPFEIRGDSAYTESNQNDYMLLSASANRAKSWSCEHCVNWRELKDEAICRSCYWAFPEDYQHVAMRQVRRADIVWQGNEVEVYTRLKKKTEQLQKTIPQYVKEIIEKHI